MDQQSAELKNPILEQENYHAEYQDSIDKLRNDPRFIEFDKLVYEVFEMNPQGKRLLELMKEKYLTWAISDRKNPYYEREVLWAEGFKDAWREILGMIRGHQQRNAAGK